MFPIRDDIPSSRFPYATVSLIIINTLVFFYELSLGQKLPDFLARWGLVPVNVSMVFKDSMSWGPSVIKTTFTSMFLHGGWIHLIGNMWFLWIFGDNVEDRLGSLRFVLFYLACGFVGAMLHSFFNPNIGIPCIGASGAIAGVLGAYMISFPFASVITLVPFFFFFTFVRLPAFLFLGFWFLIQFMSGSLSLASSQYIGGIAWWAHIGGFLSGIMLFSMFAPAKPPTRRRSTRYYRYGWG